MLSAGPTAESLLIGAVGVLCLLGLVMVYSASSVASVQGGASSWAVVSRQALYMAIDVWYNRTENKELQDNALQSSKNPLLKE